MRSVLIRVPLRLGPAAMGVWPFLCATGPLLLLFGAAVIARFQPNAPQRPLATREERWKEDLDFFAREFPNKQLDFEKLYSKEQFRAEVERLREELSGNSDVEIFLRLKRLVASAHVGHTLVRFPSGEM